MAVFRPKYRDKETGELKESKIWWYNFTFRLERERGYPDHEDLWTPGFLEYVLTPGTPVGFIASTKGACEMRADEGRQRPGSVTPFPRAMTEAPQFAAMRTGIVSRSLGFPQRRRLFPSRTSCGIAPHFFSFRKSFGTTAPA